MSTTHVQIAAHVEQVWQTDILPALHEYIAIPCVSAMFDPQWAEHGHLHRAIGLIERWCRTRAVAGLSVEVITLPGRTPMIVMEVPAFGAAGTARPDDTVVLYGHLDKQPEMTGWRDGLGPWMPVLDGDRLYGRGGADDGYSAFASMLAIEAAQHAGLSHTRCIVLIEASEESGSPDLPAYLHALADRISSPSLVLCLDSGCLDYERLWATTSLRGMISAQLRVEILTEGVHSGEASGVVASSFRILRGLLDRIENVETGELRLPELHVEIPSDRRAQSADTAIDFTIADHLPFVDGAGPTTDDATEQLLRQTWRPTLSVTGVDGIPPLDQAGNVLRPTTAITLSIRLPPTCEAAVAYAALERVLLADPPYGARVTLTHPHHADGWNAPSFAPWLQHALRDASEATFGLPSRAFGEGGSIPFMGMLAKMFPGAQFVVTGVLGPGSNAHGPNEYLHVPSAKHVTAVLAHVLDAHARRA